MRVKVHGPGASAGLVKNNKPRFVLRLMVTEPAASPIFVIPQWSRGR